MGFKIEKSEYLNFFGLWGWWFNSCVLKRRILPERQFAFFSQIHKKFSYFENLFSLPCGLACFIVGEKYS